MDTGSIAPYKDALEELLERSLEEVVFGFVIVGQTALGEACCLADVIHGDVCAPSFGNGLKGGIDDLGLTNRLELPHSAASTNLLMVSFGYNALILLERLGYHRCGWQS